MDYLIISDSELFNINKKILCLWSQNILRHFFLPPGIGTVKQSDFGARIKEHSMTQG